MPAAVVPSAISGSGFTTVAVAAARPLRCHLSQPQVGGREEEDKPPTPSRGLGLSVSRSLAPFSVTRQMWPRAPC